MNSPRNTSQPITAANAIASAMAVAAPMVGVTFVPPKPAGNMDNKTMPLSAQDQAWVEAKIEARVAETKADVRLNTQALTDLKERFVDLSGKMSTVPSDIATMKERVSHLPTKEYMVRGLVICVGILGAIVTYGEKLQALVR